MTIKIIKQPDVHVTESELARYQDEYQQAYMFFAGTPPTLEEFIRRTKTRRINMSKPESIVNLRI